MAGELNVLCAGAVKGLVLALQSGFERASGVRLHATFGAVGAMRDVLRSGAPCDVFIATDAMIGRCRRAASCAPRRSARSAACRRRSRSRRRRRRRRSTAPSRSRPPSSLAARSTSPTRPCRPPARTSPRSSSGSPSATRSRRACACSPTARSRCASSPAPTIAAIGCTQATEIRYTPGLALVGALPPPFALATVYSAAVAAGARDDEGALRFIDLLAGASSADLRRAGGFDEVRSGRRLVERPVAAADAEAAGSRERQRDGA